MRDELTHVDAEGRARMVDVTAKPATVRTAEASGFVRMSAAAVRAIQSHQTPKGDPLEAARLAGIMAAKRTAELIPLCHPLLLTHVDVELHLRDDGIAVRSSVTTSGPTGVEMEALTAAAIAALTLYDMCKAIDKTMTITDLRLERKTGGRSGDFVRCQQVTE
jgi:cyclic pyranopterin phosphate synthase